VSGQASPFNKRIRSSILGETIDAAIVQAHHFQVADSEFLELVRQRLRDFEKRREDNE
jgi:hypothetical protein